MDYCCRREIVPLINQMKHINGIDEMRKYVENMTVSELNKYGFENTEKGKTWLISSLQDYFLDKELLLKGSMLDLNKDNIIFVTEKSDNFCVYIGTQLYYLSNIFTIANIKRLIKKKIFNKYKYENIIFYIPKENVRLRTIKNDISDFIPTLTTFDLAKGKIKSVKLTKDYIEQCYNKPLK